MGSVTPPMYGKTAKPAVKASSTKMSREDVTGLIKKQLKEVESTIKL